MDKKQEDVRCAFNADKQALQERVTHLEQELSNKLKQQSELQSQLTSTQETDSMQRNELNLWNGKVQNMRRDLEMQQGFNQKLLAENKDLKDDVNGLKRAHAAKEHEAGLLQRQIRGLEEDNARLAAMFS